MGADVGARGALGAALMAGYARYSQGGGGVERGMPPPMRLGSARQTVARLALAVAACGAYLVAGSGIILLNQYVLNTDGFRFPITLSLLGFIFSSFASNLYCSLAGVHTPGNHITFSFYLTRIMPVGLMMCITIATGNMVYLYLSVSFIQMLKALAPVLTMALLIAAGLERPTNMLIVSVCTIAAGTGVASLGEVHFVLGGVLIMLASIAADACRLVAIQFLFTKLRMHPMEALKYMAPACALWLFAGAAALEFPAMLRSDALQRIAARPLLYALAAVFGFIVNSLAYIAIKLTSSLTIKVLGAAKDAAVVVLSVALLGEQVTPLQLGGYLIALGGFALYNWVVQQRATAAAAAAAAARIQAHCDTHTHAYAGAPMRSSGSSSSVEDGDIKGVRGQKLGQRGSRDSGANGRDESSVRLLGGEEETPVLTPHARALHAAPALVDGGLAAV